jgi:hypothetical protein
MPGCPDGKGLVIMANINFYSSTTKIQQKFIENFCVCWVFVGSH